MKLWHIKNNDFEIDIEVGSVTVLKGSKSTWFKLVRLIEDYFTNRSSEVTVLEDTQLLHKKDFECLLIPYDAHLQLDKITAKSPLRSLIDEVSQEISLSPTFMEFISLWEEMKEELEFLTKKFRKYDIRINLKEFSVNEVKSFIQFQAKDKILTPLEYKKLLLSLFADTFPEKRRLVIVELPELYADEEKLSDFKREVNSLVTKGTSFIFVCSTSDFKGNMNYIFNDQVINNAKVELVKRKILNELPFYCDDELFEQARKLFIESVDNSAKSSGELLLSTSKDEKLSMIVLLLTYHLNISVNYDISTFSENLKAFVNSIS